MKYGPVSYIIGKRGESVTVETIIRPIAHIKSDFTDKFGIPRQSGLVPELTARIVFEPAYRDPNAPVGLEGYSHLWLIWQFSTVAAEYAAGQSWRPTVRPPRLGGNERRGVFATRSPSRPNALGLSCVELAGVENGELIVRGADLLFFRDVSGKKKNHGKSDLNCLQENKKTLLPLKSASPFGLALLFTYLALFPI